MNTRVDNMTGNAGVGTAMESTERPQHVIVQVPMWVGI